MNETQRLDNGLNPPTKRKRLVRHSLRFKQPGSEEAIVSDLDDGPYQFQLERAICLAISAVGFDAVKLEALEAFRMHVEEYMLKFLSTARAYANAAHRSQGIPQDFIAALAEARLTPSSLTPYLKAPIPSSIVQPALVLPPPDTAPPPTMNGLLGSELNGHNLAIRKRYIPSHIPDLPSRHTWQSTNSAQRRETNPRKIREEATSEGITAEQALRKLAIKQRETAHRKAIRDRHLSKQQRDQEMWEQTVKGLQRLDREEESKRESMEVESSDRNWGMIIDGGGNIDSIATLDYGASTMVNYERQYWTKGAQAKA